jgi:hypothetical protein
MAGKDGVITAMSADSDYLYASDAFSADMTYFTRT